MTIKNGKVSSLRQNRDAAQGSISARTHLSHCSKSSLAGCMIQLAGLATFTGGGDVLNGMPVLRQPWASAHVHKQPSVLHGLAPANIIVRGDVGTEPSDKSIIQSICAKTQAAPGQLDITEYSPAKVPSPEAMAQGAGADLRYVRSLTILHPTSPGPCPNPATGAPLGRRQSCPKPASLQSKLKSSDSPVTSPSFATAAREY